MVHNHVNVGGGDAIFIERSLVASGFGLFLLWSSSFSSGLCLGRCELAFSELSGLGLLQAGVGILELEFTENSE